VTGAKTSNLIKKMWYLPAYNTTTCKRWPPS